MTTHTPTPDPTARTGSDAADGFAAVTSAAAPSNTIASARGGAPGSGLEGRYVRPPSRAPWFHRVAGFLTAHGVSLLGSRILAVRGRTSGEWRTTPVNLMRLDGERYLVAPRGHTQWVRNIRVAGGGELRLGRKVEEITVTELPDEEKIPVLRTYLKNWGWEVGQFFEGLNRKATDAELAAVAPGFPVFRINR